MADYITDYDDLTPDQLRALARERGVEANITELEKLDEFIDRRRYDSLQKYHLEMIADYRGVDITDLSYIEGEIDQRLKDYDNGKVDPRFITKPAVYEYAQWRNSQRRARRKFYPDLDAAHFNRQVDVANFSTRVEAPVNSIDYLTQDILDRVMYPDYVSQTPVTYLMTLPEEWIEDVLRRLGYEEILPELGSRDRIDILWWRYALKNIGEPRVDNLEGRTMNALRSEYRESFDDSDSNAYVFFTMLHEMFPPQTVTRPESLQLIRTYTPFEIAKIATFFLSRRKNVPGGKMPFLSPYQLFFREKPSVLYPYFTHWAPDPEMTLEASNAGAKNLARELGMIFPPSAQGKEYRYFVDNINRYTLIFQEDPDYPEEDHYDDYELSDMVGGWLPDDWEDRVSLFRQLIQRRDRE